MTEKLYYDDSYKTRFDAKILKTIEYDGKPAVILDQTLFYPTSGGQMHDIGFLNDIKVLDVIVKNDSILHILEQRINNDKVKGEIDWSRRFDFMQQHTAFHILAGSFKHQLNVETLASHLGEAFSTIETNADNLTDNQLESVELLANQVVWQERPVTAYFADERNLDNPQLRKIPGLVENVRLVEVKDFDLDPCGGTHVSSTGQVGSIKIIAKERVRGAFRFTFVAGKRALTLFQQYESLLFESGNILNTGFKEIPDKIEKIIDENKSNNKRIQQIEKEQELSIAEKLVEKLKTENISIYTIKDGKIDALRRIASTVIKQTKCTVLLGSTGIAPSLVFATFNKDIDLRPAFAKAIQQINGKGGGSPDFVQGGGTISDNVEMALEQAKKELE